MQSAKFSFLAIIAGLIFLTVIGVLMSHGGQQGISGRGADWAHHLSLIETLLQDGNRETIKTTGRLGEMAVYPPLTHWMCALVSRLFHLPPPRMLQLLCLFWAYAGCLLLGIRYVRAIESQQHHSRGNRALTFLILIVAGGLSFCGFGIFGHLVFNFFYPQLVATVMAMWFLELVKKYRNLPFSGMLVLVHILGSFLLCTHLLAGLWFYLAAYLIVIPVEQGWKKSVGVSFGFGLTSGLVIGFNPYVSAMIHISENDGVFGVITGRLESRSLLILVYGLALALGIGLCMAAYKQGFTNLSNFLRTHAGFLSIVLLASANIFVLLLFEMSSWYSITKYLLIFACELPIALISLWRYIFRPTPSESRQMPGRAFPVWGIMLFLIVQIPWGRWIHNDMDLLTYRQQLLQVRTLETEGGRVYPQFQELLCEENYYLAISILHIPRDERTMHWFAQGCTGETPLKVPTTL